MTTVAILLPTYNSSSFIRPQIYSILCQTDKDWHLYISDDASSDNTFLTLQSIINNDARVFLFKHTINQGLKNNMIFLIDQVIHKNYDYVFFCDHDDIWDLHKIYSLKRLLLPEKVVGAFSDLILMGDQDNIFHYSFLSYQGQFFPKERSSLFYYFQWQNFIPGCSFVIKKDILKKCLPLPECALVHDWWIIAMASFYGEISYSPTPLIYYRQHKKNEIGASSSSSVAIISKLVKLSFLWTTWRNFQKTLLQRKELYHRCYPFQDSRPSWRDVTWIMGWHRKIKFLLFSLFLFLPWPFYSRRMT